VAGEKISGSNATTNWSARKGEPMSKKGGFKGRPSMTTRGHLLESAQKGSLPCGRTGHAQERHGESHKKMRNWGERSGDRGLSKKRNRERRSTHRTSEARRQEKRKFVVRRFKPSGLDPGRELPD